MMFTIWGYDTVGLKVQKLYELNHESNYCNKDNAGYRRQSLNRREPETRDQPETKHTKNEDTRNSEETKPSVKDPWK